MQLRLVSIGLIALTLTGCGAHRSLRDRAVPVRAAHGAVVEHFAPRAVVVYACHRVETDAAVECTYALGGSPDCALARVSRGNDGDLLVSEHVDGYCLDDTTHQP